MTPTRNRGTLDFMTRFTISLRIYEGFVSGKWFLERERCTYKWYIVVSVVSMMMMVVMMMMMNDDE